MSSSSPPQKTAVDSLALIWGGIVFGSSFLATRAKFFAPSLTLPTALEVGRVTFRTLLVAELAFLFIISTVLLITRQNRWWLWTVAVILAVQWLAVMPLLNARTDAVVSGAPASGPPWHLAYIALEFAKIVVLLAGGTHIFQAAAHRRASARRLPTP